MMAVGCGWRGVVAVWAVGLLLRLPRAVLRWDEVALAYAAYPGPHLAALRDGRPLDALSLWMGLHPPLWPALHAVAELALPVPAVWLLAGALASAGAAALVAARFGWGPGLLLATSPVAVDYAAEVNNYPWAALAVAAVLLPQPTVGAGLRGVVAGWVHLLGAAAAAGAWVEGALRARLRGGGPALSVGLLGGAPIAAGVVARARDGGTFAQPAGGLDAWLAQLGEVYGVVVYALPALAGIGLGAPGTGAALGLLGGLGVALGMGAAAPHQLPYASLAVVPLAALASGAAQRLGRLGAAAVAAVVLLQAGVSAARLFEAADELARGRSVVRAADEARARSAPGDLIWLVAPALRPDDDKQAVSASLWAFSPLAWMPARPSTPQDPLDPRFGHPRAWRGRVLHTSVELDDAIVDAVLAARPAGARAFFVLAEHAPAAGLDARVRRALQPWAGEPERWPAPGGLGDDLLFVVEPSP